MGGLREKTLNEKINAEAARAKTAEAAETSRATAAEKANADAIAGCVQYIGSIAAAYSSLAELYQAGQNNYMKIGIYQWNLNLRPADDNGIVFIGNWAVIAESFANNARYNLQSDGTWKQIN